MKTSCCLRNKWNGIAWQSEMHDKTCVVRKVLVVVRADVDGDELGLELQFRLVREQNVSVTRLCESFHEQSVRPGQNIWRNLKSRTKQVES